MNKSETKKLIRAAGGDIRFAELLGIKIRDGVAQRVNNWKRRGLPASVQLRHYEKIQALIKQVSG